MKLKYYLRGLGIGIIVTTVILAVSFSKKEIKMSDEEIMARAAQLGMVMQETETTEQGDTEQDPDGTDTGAKTEVVTEQTASELLEERTAAEETAQNTETAAEDVAAEAQEDSANTDEETQAQQEAHTLVITLIGIADTNCDPEELDYVIPGNDDAIRAVKLIVSKMADAVIEANQGAEMTAEEAESAEADAAEEA